MSSPRSRSLLLLLTACACTLRPHDPGATGTTTGTTSTSGPSPEHSTTSLAPTTTTNTPTTTTSSPTTTTTTTTTDPTGTFIPYPDGGGGLKECDPWTENCPEGQKCMPVSLDGDSAWESLKCVDIVPDPDAPGAPCTVFGSGVSGEDTCDKHAVCWNPDPDTGIGTCVAMCTGSPDATSCDEPWISCFSTGDGVLNFCFPPCDPITQDCNYGDLCIPAGTMGEFICALDASGEAGQLFDPCEYADTCDPGLYCVGPELASECDPQALGCCLPFCDLDDPNTCPGQGQQCVPWYDDLDQVAPFNQDVGLCGLPQP